MPYYTPKKPVLLSELYQVDSELDTQVREHMRLTREGQIPVALRNRSLDALDVDAQLDVIELLLWQATPGIH